MRAQVTVRWWWWGVCVLWVTGRCTGKSSTHTLEAGASKDVMRDNNSYGAEIIFANGGFRWPCKPDLLPNKSDSGNAPLKWLIQPITLLTAPCCTSHHRNLQSFSSKTNGGLFWGDFHQRLTSTLVYYYFRITLFPFADWVHLLSICI